MTHYEPETYWSAVARRIGGRKSDQWLAGDAEPFYEYKRSRVVNWLKHLDVKKAHVLEVGCGPGGNLKVLESLNPASLTGADISAEMIKLAKSHVKASTRLVKVSGGQLPFDDRSFDISLTVTVLQHNTDPAQLTLLIAEICRVTRQRVILVERIEKHIKGDELCLGRPVSYYQDLMTHHGFNLESTTFINIRISYLVCGAMRKLFNTRSRKEGEPVSQLSRVLQRMTLPVTKALDKVFKSNTDLAFMVFRSMS